MPTAIKVLIKSLDCLTTKVHHCEGCIFNPHKGMEWPYGCDRGQIEMVRLVQTMLRTLDNMEDDLK